MSETDRTAFMGETVPGIPRTERVWTEYLRKDGQVFWITSKLTGSDTFYVYKHEDGKAVRLGKDASPLVLERRYIRG